MDTNRDQSLRDFIDHGARSVEPERIPLRPSIFTEAEAAGEQVSSIFATLEADAAEEKKRADWERS